MTLTVVSPLAIEAMALRRSGLRVETIGVGPANAREAAARWAEVDGRLVLAGFGGALDDTLEPGDVVVATEAQSHEPERSASFRSAAFRSVACEVEPVAGALERGGARVTRAAVASSEHVVTGAERRALSKGGAVAVDMESYWLADRRAVSVIRVIVDTPSRELVSLSTFGGGVRALRALQSVGAALRHLVEEEET